MDRYGMEECEEEREEERDKKQSCSYHLYRLDLKSNVNGQSI